jgi:5'-3' exonuclease
VWALHGFCTTLAKLVAMRSPSHVLVALDAAGGCPSRRALLPGYKAGRDAPRPDLSDQLTAMPLLLAEAGIAALAVSGWEADDVVASAAATATAAGGRCDIFTADRDVFQLLNSQVAVVRIDGTEFGPAHLAEKYGVSPAQYRELAAMRGEAADAIAGVPGVGEKTATKLLTAFGSFADALADPERLASVVGPRLATRLLDSAELVATNLEVAGLNQALTVDLDVAALPFDGPRIAAALRRAHLPAAASALAAACGSNPPHRRAS